jgi:hypothetical protein
VVVGSLERGRNVLNWEPVGYYVMGGLDVEGFFDFGVGCYEEVEENEERDEEVENYIC